MHLPQSCDAHGEILEALERKKPTWPKVMREHIRDLTAVLQKETVKSSLPIAAASTLRRGMSRQRV